MAHTSPSHCVAVIGGAVAGAEIAGALADGGADVVVFEQNPRPYGKIEDGLPRWHVALRRKEYGAITRHLSKPGVHYVPHTQVGRDVSFAELVNDWGFSGVVLANGAWRDRTLPVEGADDYIDKGLVYQNPFVIWFNHMNEAAYDGQTFDVHDGTIVVGGGLASIDVAKILMLETTRAKLAERGIEVAMLDLEVKGIPKILERHELAFEDLGLEGCTIYYRRDIEDMPLAEIPKGADAARTKKVRASRRKLLEKAMGKYRFSIEPLCMPDGLIVEDDRLAGLRFRRTKMENGRPVPTDETFERRGPQVISSIGSIPLAIEGIPMMHRQRCVPAQVHEANLQQVDVRSSNVRVEEGVDAQAEVELAELHLDRDLPEARNADHVPNARILDDAPRHRGKPGITKEEPE